MNIALFALASLFPALALAARSVMVRLDHAKNLATDGAILLASPFLGIWLIDRSLQLPLDAGDHSPGVGVAFIPAAMVWFICSLIWFARAGLLILRRRSASERGRLR